MAQFVVSYRAYYRERAALMRASADVMGDPPASALMLRIAAALDGLADREEPTPIRGFGATGRSAEGGA